jgi:hypothetical protein
MTLTLPKGTEETWGLCGTSSFRNKESETGGEVMSKKQEINTSEQQKSIIITKKVLKNGLCSDTDVKKHVFLFVE